MKLTTTEKATIRDYFRSRIDYHVNGMLARQTTTRFDLRREGLNIEGDVTNAVITVTREKDGAEFRYAGGKYSERKRNLCYAPLMPKPVTPGA